MNKNLQHIKPKIEGRESTLQPWDMRVIQNDGKEMCEPSFSL